MTGGKVSDTEIKTCVYCGADLSEWNNSQALHDAVCTEHPCLECSEENDEACIHCTKVKR